MEIAFRHYQYVTENISLILKVKKKIQYFESQNNKRPKCKPQHQQQGTCHHNHPSQPSSLPITTNPKKPKPEHSTTGATSLNCRKS